MKILKTIVTILIITVLCNTSIAQSNNFKENSVLWKIEHPNLEKASYVYGTLHMMCESDFNIPEKVTLVMNEVEDLALEVNISDPAEMKSIQSMMASAKPVSQEVSKEQFQKLNALIQEKLGVPLKQIDSYGLSTINMIMASKMLPCDTLKYMETELIQIATAKGLTINSLETGETQMKYINKGYPSSFAYQQILLFDKYKSDFRKTIHFYKDEDLTQAVALLTKEEYMDANAIEYILTRRNEDWVAKMPEMMKTKQTLFAVGAAHLVGDQGILNLLIKKGYTVTAVLK